VRGLGRGRRTRRSLARGGTGVAGLLNARVGDWPGVRITPMFGRWGYFVGTRLFACFPLRAKDADLWVRLLDVAEDGTAFNVMSPGLDVQRASYRDADGGRQLLTPDQVYEIKLTHLITSNLFKKGHRIRVQISGSFFPNFSRNLQTGESEATASRAQKATLRIYHDPEHPSAAVLPIAGR